MVGDTKIYTTQFVSGSYPGLCVSRTWFRVEGIVPGIVSPLQVLCSTTGAYSATLQGC